VKTKCGIAMLLVAMAVTLCAAMPAAAPAQAGLNSYEMQIVNLVNAQRVAHHMAEFRLNAKLMQAARAHSKDMAQRDYFAHNTLGRETWSRRIIKCGYSPSGCRMWSIGENIYRGTGLYADPHIVVLGAGATAKGWMTSPPHRRVILTKSFRDIGISAYKITRDNATTWYFTLDLGRRVK